MQFERLRKNHKRKIIIGGLILVCITSAITITTTRAKYKLTQDIPLVRGYINYIADREKPIINNVTTSVTKTEINVSVSATDNIGVTEYWYSINNGAYTKKTTSSHTFTGLSAGTTYTVKVYVKDAKGNQSTITTKSIQTAFPTSEETLAKLNITNYKTTTPDFSKVATTDEGIYRVSDGMYGGYSYYWRGATTNNYLKFANKCWRIIRINGDGTIRLIYDGKTCQSNGAYNAGSIEPMTPYSKSSQPNYVGWTYSGTLQRPSDNATGTSSKIKNSSENWYDSNLASYAAKIADGKFCNDRDTASGNKYSTTSAFLYAANERIKSATPTLLCPSEDIYVLKIGLITADEAIYAGGKSRYNNASYYLNNGHSYWTMSPNRWYSPHAYVTYIAPQGGIYETTASNNTSPGPGFRPVINLRSDVTFSGGDGTKNNPYVVQ